MATYALLAQYPSIFVPLAAILGLLVGSFLNVVIYRLPKILAAKWTQEAKEYLELPHETGPEFSLSTPSSACPCCHRPIRPWENVPVVSFLLLRGKCAGCGMKISLRYPAIELLGSLVGALAFWRFGFSIEALAFACAFWVLIAAAMIDIDQMLLPDALMLPLIWGGLLLAAYISPQTAAEHLMGAAIGYGVFRVIPIGRGDAKLAAAAGAWMGWIALPFFFTAGAVLGAIMGMVYLAVYKKSKPYPFGPALAISFLLAAFFGRQYATYLGIA